MSLLHEVLSEKFNIIEVTDALYDLIIDCPFGNEPLPNNNNVVKLFVTGEVIKQDNNKWSIIDIKSNLHKYDLSIGFDFITHPKYLRIPYMYNHSRGYDIHNIHTHYDRGKCNPTKPFFACFLVSNGGWTKYHEGAKLRNRLFHKLSSYKHVHSGGKYLNNIGNVVSLEETGAWLSQCKFIIAYENQSYPGYVTEKPIQAYLAGAIPIYYSHPAGIVDEEINKKSMINATDLATEDELVEYIKKVDNDDNLYCNIWQEQFIINPARNYEVIKEKLQDKLEQIFKEKGYSFKGS